MKQQNEVQGELFALPAKVKRPRARRRRRKTANAPQKVIGQYEPDIPSAEVVTPPKETGHWEVGPPEGNVAMVWKKGSGEKD